MRDNIKVLLNEGLEVSKKDVSLVDISTYVHSRADLARKWHLTSSKYNKLYESQDEAIDMFFKLIGKE
jgi:hypothetical protein